MVSRIFYIFIALWTIACSLTQQKSLPAACATANVTEQDVATQVFSQYGNWMRPIRNVNRSVVVNITLALSAINDVIEKDRILRVTGYIGARWYDELRVWNTTFPLSCVTYVVVPASSVWLPDIAMMNAEGRYTLMQLSGEKVRIYSDGFSYYSPGGTFSVFCDFDCTNFPFDEQRCSIKFESWRYTHPFMEFRFHTSSVKLYQWSENGQWSLKNTSQELFGLSYFDPENSFDRVEFHLHLKRKSTYYITSIVIPCAIILVAQFAIFALPVEEVQKLSILFTCLLSYLVFELMVMGELPRSSDHVPLLTKYLDISMGMITFSILCECIVFALLRRAKTPYPDGPGFVSPWLRNFTIVTAKLCCSRINFPYKDLTMMTDTMPSSVATATTGDGSNNSESNNNGNTKIIKDSSSRSSKKAMTMELENMPDAEMAMLQWRIVASLVDRITLIIYLSANIAIPIVMFIIIPNCS